MSYEFYNNAFIVALVLSVIMFIITVLLFFILNIRVAIGDITGLSKRKAIENLQNKGKTSKTDNRPIYRENSAAKAAENLAQESMKTSKISPQDRYDNLEAPETSLLEAPPVPETSVLSSEAENVGSIAESNSNGIAANFVSVTGFSIETEITFVHSNEVIR